MCNGGLRQDAELRGSKNSQSRYLSLLGLCESDGRILITAVPTLNGLFHKNCLGLEQNVVILGVSIVVILQ